MSYDCVCDYDAPAFYQASQVKAARKEHRCEECARAIKAGEGYECVRGMWDGRLDVFKTCANCVALREWVKAHVPCFCWAHGNIREDALNTADHYSHEAPDLLFGAWRREVKIRRAAIGQAQGERHDG